MLLQLPRLTPEEVAAGALDETEEAEAMGGSGVATCGTEALAVGGSEATFCGAGVEDGVVTAIEVLEVEAAACELGVSTLR